MSHVSCLVKAEHQDTPDTIECVLCGFFFKDIAMLLWMITD